MKRMLARLWKDQRGAVSAVSALLLYTILVLGVTVGLVTLRNQVVQEFGDLSVSLDSLDQSWQVRYSWDPLGEFRGTTGLGPTLTDPDDSEPAGISVRKPPIAEGESFP